MAQKTIVIDTSLLIDFFRKTDKANSSLMALVRAGYSFCISAVTEYEIYSGATASQKTYWEELLKKTVVLPFDQQAVKKAVEINVALKQKRKQIALADLFIAATAVTNELPFATLNKKHFVHIESLTMVE